MKRLLVGIGIMLTLFSLSACNNDSQMSADSQRESQEILYFNTPDSLGGGPGCGWPEIAMFTRSVTEEELHVVFPSIELISETRAFYRRINSDGTGNDLIGIQAVLPNFGDAWSSNSIEIAAEGHGLPPDFIDFPQDFVPRISDVYGVPVTVAMFGGDWARFRAEFMLGNTTYRVIFYDYKDVGQARMAELVTQLILGGTECLAFLDNPFLSVQRETVRRSIEEARHHPDFGAYVPTYIPDRFFPLGYWESYVGDDDSFWLQWRTEANVGFERIWWNVWKAEEPYQWETATVFLAAELTLDIIRANAHQGDFNMGDGSFPYQFTDFSVRIDDVIIIFSANGVSPEEVWTMFAEFVGT